MSVSASITTGLASLPSWLTDTKEADALEVRLSGWVRASGYRSVAILSQLDGRSGLAVRASSEGVSPLSAPPAEVHDVLRALKAGQTTAVWQIPQSSGRLYTIFQPAGRPAGLLWAEREVNDPWTETDRHYLVLTVRLIERSPALAARIGPLLQSEQLDRRLADAAVIAGRMAHDFDNILTGIIGFADLSVPLIPAGSQPAKFVAEISKVGQRGIVFTQQLHQLSRSAASKPQPGSVANAWTKEETRLRSTLPAGVHFVGDVPVNLAPVAVELGPLSSLLGLILDNAVEASPPQSRISVSARVVDLNEADIRNYLGSAQPGPNVEILVQDRGVGIKPEHWVKLFAEPFFTTKVRHRGLGLAIAYRILNAHHGGIRIDSATPPDAGTTVRLILPLAAARPSAVAGPQHRTNTLNLVGG